MDTMKLCRVRTLQRGGCDLGGGENGFKWVLNGFPALGERVLYRQARDGGWVGKLLSGKELGEAGW